MHSSNTILQNLEIYRNAAKRFVKEQGYSISIWDLIRFFPSWLHSQNKEVSPLMDQVPWLTFAAIQFLEKHLTQNMRVYEYGAGGSTLFFAARVSEVVSVEHDPVWTSKVNTLVDSYQYKNVKICLVKPTPQANRADPKSSDPNAYCSALKKYTEYSFQDYASSIDDYPDEYFDLVFIDGRARPSCCKHSLSKVKQNGFILLDNSERIHYAYIHETLDRRGWKKFCFGGPGPYGSKFWQTCIWHKNI
jgi:hypothetical protein